MSNVKKILVTTESQEVFILRTYSRDHAFGICGYCGREVEMLTFDQAITETGLRAGRLIKLAEANELHAVETPSGHLIVCAASIARVNAGRTKGVRNEYE